MPSDRDNPVNSQGLERVELASASIDEELQTIAGDPFGGLTSVGLRVPTLASTRGDLQSRYLMMLASCTVPEGRRARILGFRQLLTIGLVQNAAQNPRIVELDVESPFFKFPNGNVSWHLRQMSQSEPFSPLAPGNTLGMSLVTPGPPLVPLRNLAWRMSDTPALLFQRVTTPNFDPFYVNLTAYQAPNAGRPWGRDLAGLGAFYDLRTQWRDTDGWSSLDIPVEGPTRICLFASVHQTNPIGRPVVAPGANDTSGGALSPEERFILNYPTAIYWRVGGSLIVKYDDPEE